MISRICNRRDKPLNMPKALFMAMCFALECAAFIAPAKAQMQLPGAFTPAPIGATATPGGDQKPKPKKKPGPPPPPKAATADGVLGRVLLQNGRNGALEFRRDGKELRLVRLKLAGEQISRAGEPCEVDIGGETVPLKEDGKPQGVLRYRVGVEVCPFSLDLLDGAAMALGEGKACEFKAADCRVDPTGLWGQPAVEIGPQRAKEIEHARHAAEQRMRTNFRAWLASVGKDRAMVTRIAREQASFSSKREELCRTYARESQHGYCALVATEARNATILAHVLPPEIHEEEPPRKKPGKR